jgi:hypothetical protein
MSDDQRTDWGDVPGEAAAEAEAARSAAAGVSPEMERAAAEAEAAAAQSAEEGGSLIHRPGEEPAEGQTEPWERIE